jgi:hypothetical protein
VKVVEGAFIVLIGELFSAFYPRVPGWKSVNPPVNKESKAVVNKPFAPFLNTCSTLGLRRHNIPFR